VSPTDVEVSTSESKTAAPSDADAGATAGAGVGAGAGAGAGAAVVDGIPVETMPSVDAATLESKTLTDYIGRSYELVAKAVDERMVRWRGCSHCICVGFVFVFVFVCVGGRNVLRCVECGL